MKKQKEQVLSIEQMQELINMGIDTSNASCIWWNFADTGFRLMMLDDGKDTITIEKMKENHGAETVVPTFTITDILELLPGELPVKSKEGFTYFINITPSKSKSFWNVSYEDVYDEEVNGIKLVGVDWLHIERDESLLIACFNMLKWCKEQKYI